MQVRLFDELEAAEGGVPVPVRGAKQRALLGYCVGMSTSPPTGVLECEEAVDTLRPVTTRFTWPRRWWYSRRCWGTHTAGIPHTV